VHRATDGQEWGGICECAQEPLLNACRFVMPLVLSKEQSDIAITGGS